MKLFDQLKSKHIELRGWKLKVCHECKSISRDCLGYCDYDNRMIVLYHDDDLKLMRETLVHEVCHVLSKRGHGHDEVWLNNMRSLGYNQPNDFMIECKKCNWETRVTELSQSILRSKCNLCHNFPQIKNIHTGKLVDRCDEIELTKTERKFGINLSQILSA